TSTSSWPRTWTGTASTRSPRMRERRACARRMAHDCAWRSAPQRSMRSRARKGGRRPLLVQGKIGPVGAVVLGEVVEDQLPLFILELGHALLLDHPINQLVPALTAQALLGN